MFYICAFRFVFAVFHSQYSKPDEMQTVVIAVSYSTSNNSWVVLNNQWTKDTTHPSMDESCPELIKAPERYIQRACR